MLRTGRKEGDILCQYKDFTLTANRYIKENGYTRKVLLDLISYCIDNNILSEYLTRRKSEVVSLMMTLYDQAYAVDCYGKEQYNEGRNEGLNEGRNEGRKEGLNAGIKGSITILKNMNVSRDDALNKIMSVYNLNKTDVDSIFNSCWI